MGGHDAPTGKNKDAYDAVGGGSFVPPDRPHDRERNEATLGPRSDFYQDVIIYSLTALLGVIMGISIWAITLAEHDLMHRREAIVDEALKSGDLGLAVAKQYGISLGMVLLCVVLCLFQPGMQSSGIPALIAYLNGSDAPKPKSPITGKETDFLGLPLMLCKGVGLIFCIASGIAVGPEGPIIHFGACMGVVAINYAVVLANKFGKKEIELTDVLELVLKDVYGPSSMYTPLLAFLDATLAS